MGVDTTVFWGQGRTRHRFYFTFYCKKRVNQKKFGSTIFFQKLIFKKKTVQKSQDDEEQTIFMVV